MRVHLILNVALLAFSLAFAEAQELGFGTGKAAGKLPKEVVPHAYKISLVPDLARLSEATGRETVGFTGHVQIQFEALQPAQTITLNAHEISVVRATIDGAAARVGIDRRNETVNLTPLRPLAAGRHVLAIEYSGTILAHQEGLFYSVYDTPAGRRWVLATDLEPSGARRVFPGWDEPAFKATFELSVTAPANFRALSNMPVAGERVDDGGRKVVSFAATPRMSSYLFVLVVGDYDRISTVSQGVDIGVVVPGYQVPQGRYALEVAARTLAFFNDYFGVKYPLPKLDNILVPRNFSGAMENWGGVIYSERALLFDESTGSADDRKVVHEFVVHELAHQWFGNLVTMKWWDDLWLNEGFASWMEKKLTDEFNPSMKVWVRTRVEKEKAMAKDALRTAHPVQQRIADEAQALAAFDDITYLKGLGLVRMLEAYLGQAEFRDGLRRYMARHAYSNATSADLWAALEVASNKPIAAIALGFSQIPGVPLIHVSTRCAGNQLMVTLRQDRYALNDPYAARQSWQVPVALGRPGDTHASHTELVGAEPKVLVLDGCDRPVKANYGDVGYYRVHYDDADLKSLGTVYRLLAPADRVSLMADARAAMLVGLTPAATYLELTRQLSDESELAVWEIVIDSVRFIDDLNTDAASQEAFRVYARALLRSAFDRLGWEARPGEEAEAALLRHRLIADLAALGDMEVAAEARRRFAMLMRDRSAVAAALREPVARAVAASADRKTYDDLLLLAREQGGDQERMIYFDALAGVRNEEFVEQTVQIARGDAKLPPAQILSFLERAARQTGHPDRVWSQVFAHRTEILARLSGRQQQQALSSIASASANPAVAFELRWADVTRGNRGMRRFADEAAEEIELKADLKTTLIPAVQQWVQSQLNR